MGHAEVLGQSLRDARKAEREEKKLTSDNTAFLPAVLEVLETPPNPLGRGILWVIMIFLALALSWMVVGQIDIVAVSQGRVIPDGRIKTVQAADAGVVRAIHVRDGQRVKLGDPLIDMDPTISDAEVEQAKEAFRVAEIDRGRAEALLNYANKTPKPFARPEGVEDAVADLQVMIVTARIAEHEAERQGLLQELTKQRRNFAMIDADVARIRQQLPLVEEQLDGLQSLQGKGLAPRTRVSEVEERAIGMRQDLIIRTEEMAGAEAAISAAQQKLTGAETTFRREALDAFNEADATRRLRQEEMTIAVNRNSRTVITSPADGTVQQLQVYTLGAVVKPADPLLVVVPNGSNLVVEANILNRDIGFVREGQDVRVKLEAFPFTRYGVVDAKLVFVSRDSIQDEKLGLVFPARVELSRFAVKVSGDETTPLTAGMAVTAEIRTGKRRIIEFLLSPLARRVEEAGRER